MASEYLGLNFGDPQMMPDEVQTGTSTNSTDIELRVDLTKITTKMDLINYTKSILRFIEDGRADSVFGVV
jgi:hypothetical protein